MYVSFRVIYILGEATLTETREFMEKSGGVEENSRKTAEVSGNEIVLQAANVLENIDITRFNSIFYQRIIDINVTFCYTADKLESWENIATQGSENLKIIAILILYNLFPQVFSKNGDLVGRFGGFGRGCGQFDKPWGVCIDRSGNILVSDEGNGRVQCFSRDCRFLKVVADGLPAPRGVSINIHENLVVTTQDPHNFLKILKYK